MVAGPAEIWIDEAEDVILAAVVAEDGPTDLLAERRDRPDLTGAVFLGRVARVDRAAQAAFVDLGLGQDGYLKLRDGVADVAAGAPLLVQVIGEPRDGKGAELTLDLALPGRFLVHTPHSPGVAVSRALGAAERAAWRDRLAGQSGGWVVRRAAASAAAETVLAEAAFLAARAGKLQTEAAAVDPARGPVRLLAPPGAAERLILDHPGIAAIRVGPAALHRHLRGWLRAAAPDLAGRLVPGPVDVIESIPALVDPVVALPGGGSLTIETTRALTTIDVDAGTARQGLAVNLAAAAVIPRQLRLRNIGGIVVIDFISLDRRAQQDQVMARLRAALAGDPADIRLGSGVSPLGLVELARRRRGRSLAEAVAGTALVAAPGAKA